MALAGEGREGEPADGEPFVLPRELVPIADHLEIRALGRSRPLAGGDEPRLTAWVRVLGAPTPLTALGGVAPINSRSKQPAVSGSRERPIPIPVTELDLKTRLRPGHHLRPLPSLTEDQVGQLPAAVILAEWIRDIRDTVWPGHHLPKPAVDELVLWLKTRIDDICDRYTDIAVFADSIRILRGALRAAAGETEPQPERCEGVPCRRCDLQMLYRQPGGDVECVNPDCRTVLRADEYRDWTKTLAAEARVKQAQHT